MSHSLRPATQRDIDIVVQFIREYYAFDHLVFDETHARRAALEMINDERLGVIWLICVDDVPVGYAVMAFIHSLECHGSTAFLDEFYLREDQRGAGLGKFAITFLVNECARRGIHALRLEVEHTNPNAQALYEKMGFVLHGRNILTRTLDA